MTEPVLFERPAPHVALVTLDRPEKRNAVDAAVSAAIEAIVRSTEADDDVRAVILASSHEHVFCAGADLVAVSRGETVGIETAFGGFAGFVFAPRTKPWIAAIEGMALAGGCELALACDMIVASERASFGLPEVRRGLMANAGGVSRLVAAIPRNVAHEMLATGASIDAAAAYRWGLVNRLVAAGEAVSTARALADEIAANAPLAVQYSLAVARNSAGQSDGAARAIANERFNALRRTDDYREGPRAFAEKRDPIWTGR